MYDREANVCLPITAAHGRYRWWPSWILAWVMLCGDDGNRNPLSGWVERPLVEESSSWQASRQEVDVDSGEEHVQIPLGRFSGSVVLLSLEAT